MQDIEEPLLNVRTPTLFVIGQHSNQCTQDDMETMRERMKAETCMVVVGGADEHLRQHRAKKKTDGLTQSMVDRCIVDEISDFLVSILTQSTSPSYALPMYYTPTASHDGMGPDSKKRKKSKVNSPPFVQLFWEKIFLIFALFSGCWIFN